MNPNFSLLRTPWKTLTLLALGAILRSLTAWATPEEGIELRAFLRDTIAVTAESDPKVRADQLRGVFARHPLPFVWMLENRDMKELIQSADIASMISVLPKNIQAASNSSSIDHYLLEYFSAWTQNNDINAPINATRLQEVSETLRKTPPFNQIQTDQWVKADPELRKKIFALLPDPAIDVFMREIENSVNNAKFSNSPILSLLEDPKNGFEFKSIPPQLRGKFNSILEHYFDRLGPEYKRPIILSVLDLPPGANLMQQFAAVIQNSGPGLQKIFQLLGSESQNPELEKLMKELLGNVKRIPPDEVKRLIEERTGKPIDETYSEFSTKPLGSGTIGQVHRARLRSTGEEVVIKLRRPGIVEAAEREMAIFEDIAKDDPPMAEVMKRAKESLFAELNFLDEEKSTRRGRVYNSKKLGLKAVKVTPGIVNREDMLTLQLAQGVPVAKLGKRDLISHGQALQNLLDRWFDEAMFHTGFFHGDLHPENIFYRRVPKGDPRFEMTVIDFGSVGSLTIDQRRGFARMMIGIIESNPEAIADALEKLASFSPEAREHFIRKMSEPGLSKFPLRDRINLSLAKALDAGVQIPASLLKFNRGQIFLEKQIQAINQRLDLHDPKGKLPRYGVKSTLAKVTIREGIEQLASQAISETAHRKAVITPDLVYDGLVAFTRQAARAIQNGCQSFYALLLRSR